MHGCTLSPVLTSASPFQSFEDAWDEWDDEDGDEDDDWDDDDDETPRRQRAVVLFDFLAKTEEVGSVGDKRSEIVIRETTNDQRLS